MLKLPLSAQSLRVIGVVVQVGVVKIYVAAVEAVRKRGEETQLPTNIGLKN